MTNNLDKMLTIPDGLPSVYMFNSRNLNLTASEPINGHQIITHLRQCKDYEKVYIYSYTIMLIL